MIEHDDYFWEMVDEGRDSARECEYCGEIYCPNAGEEVCPYCPPDEDCLHANRVISDERSPAFSDETLFTYRCLDCGATWQESLTVADQRREQEAAQ